MSSYTPVSKRNSDRTRVQRAYLEERKGAEKRNADGAEFSCARFFRCILRLPQHRAVVTCGVSMRGAVCVRAAPKGPCELPAVY